MRTPSAELARALRAPAGLGDREGVARRRTRRRIGRAPPRRLAGATRGDARHVGFAIAGRLGRQRVKREVRRARRAASAGAAPRPRRSPRAAFARRLGRGRSRSSTSTVVTPSARHAREPRARARRRDRRRRGAAHGAHAATMPAAGRGDRLVRRAGHAPRVLAVARAHPSGMRVRVAQAGRHHGVGRIEQHGGASRRARATSARGPTHANRAAVDDDRPPSPIAPSGFAAVARAGSHVTTAPRDARTCAARAHAIRAPVSWRCARRLRGSAGLRRRPWSPSRVVIGRGGQSLRIGARASPPRCTDRETACLSRRRA